MRSYLSAWKCVQKQNTSVYIVYIKQWDKIPSSVVWYLLAASGKAEQKKLVEVYQDFPSHVWAPRVKDSFVYASKEKM